MPSGSEVNSMGNVTFGLTTKKKTMLGRRGEVTSKEVIDMSKPGSELQSKVDARLKRLGVKK